jgi:hypothetical protein
MGRSMGIVIDFPSRDAACSPRRNVSAGHQGHSAGQVVILPVIRIERYDDKPAGLLTPRGNEQGRKRRRRASRS